MVRNTTSVAHPWGQGAAAHQRIRRARNVLLVGLIFEVLVLLLLITLPPVLSDRADTIRQHADTLQRLSDHHDQVDGLLQEMRAAARGYALTRSEIFLEQYETAQERVTLTFTELEPIARELDPTLEPQIIELRRLVRTWQAESGDRQITLAQEGQTSLIAQELVSGTSQALFAAFRLQSDQVRSALLTLRLELAQEISQARTLQLLVTSGLSILGLLTIGLIIVGFRQSLWLIRDLEAAHQRSAHLAEQVAQQLRSAEIRHRQLTVLHAVATAATRSVQRDEVLHNILTAIGETLDLSAAALCLTPTSGKCPQALIRRAPHPHAAPEELATLLHANAETLLASLAQNQTHYIDPQTVTNATPLADLAVCIGAPLLLLPLHGRSSAVGLLVLLDPLRRPDLNDRPFLHTLATEIGLVIDNTLLFATVQAERQRLQAVFEHSPEGIVVAEAPDGQIALLNPAASKLFGPLEPNASLLHHPLAGRTHQPGGYPCVPEDLPMLRTLHEGRATYAVELTITRPDGRRIPVLATSVPLYEPHGALQGVVGVFQDIRRLRELERLRSDVVALVNHELRTPLTTIRGSAESLLSNSHTNDPAHIRSFAQIIKQQGEQLQELLDNMLQLSQLEAGALRLQRQSLTLPPLLRSVIAHAREHMPDLRLQADVSADLAPVSIDVRRIEQVLQNLLDNAAKYSPPNGVITISAQRSEQQIVVSVRDQGPGIPPDERERVFDRFYQAARPSTRPVAGTGLGLAICKALIEAHNGLIWIDEPPGGGTLACFSLPALPADTLVDAPITPTVLASAARDHARILVLDDDAALQHLLERGFQEAGFSVQISGEAQEAMNLLNSYTPDLMIIDLALPGMDGLSLCRQVRQWSSIPIIMLTASATEQDVIKGLRAGADDYVTKPFRMQELIARIDALLRRAQQTTTPGEASLIQLDNLIIDLSHHRITLDQQEIALTPIEYQILTFLARHAGQALSHEQILQAVWGQGYSGENNYLWVHIANLRKKIEPDPRHPRFILTERGLGYRMARQ
ncbi:ATP-binding protein [Candidatus Viridilinea mediisalina]|nr:ATP-binding protein [Candidatus Viridilinea mediisalina]